MANLSIRFTPETVRTIAFGSIAAGYMGVGTAVNHPIRQFLIQNLTDAILMFSFDGINDHFPLPSNGFFLDDICSNVTHSAGWFLAEGTRLYVKEIGVPTSGTVYFSVFYGSE